MLISTCIVGCVIILLFKGILPIHMCPNIISIYVVICIYPLFVVVYSSNLLYLCMGTFFILNCSTVMLFNAFLMMNIYCPYYVEL